MFSEHVISRSVSCHALHADKAPAHDNIARALIIVRAAERFESGSRPQERRCRMCIEHNLISNFSHLFHPSS
jgi:hypothetical protein